MIKFLEMIKMKFILCLFMSCMILFWYDPVCAKKIRMAVFKLEPFMMQGENSKDITGITVQYWREFIAPEMGVELEVVGLLPILRASYMLQSGEVDVISQLTKIPEREEKFLYPDTPLTSIQSCIIVLPDSPLYKVDSQKDLYGMTIGFIQAAYIPDMMIHEKIRLDLITTTDFRGMNYKKLVKRRMDALLDINLVSEEYWLKKNGYMNKVRIIPLPVEPVYVYSIFRKTPEGQALSDAYDKANTKGIQQNMFGKISEKFLKP